MLIQFRVGNYRSFKDPVTLSMVAAKIVSQDKSLDDNTIFPAGDKLQLLTSAAVYGANASGKSNLAQAMHFMKQFVESSLQPQSSKRIAAESFAFSDVTVNQPSLFEMIFQYEGTQYRYGFEITPERVTAEWLYATPKSREICLFERDSGIIKCSPRYFKEGIGLEDKTRENVLFLSLAAAFNGEIAQKIFNWFEKFIITSGLEDASLLEYTQQCLQYEEKALDIARFINKMDLGVVDIVVKNQGSTVRSALLTNIDVLNIPKEEVDKLFLDRKPNELTPNLINHMRNYAENSEIIINLMKKFTAKNFLQLQGVFTKHRRFDEQGNLSGIDLFTFEHHESEGTKRLFALSGSIIDALRYGKVLVIDEFDARLHPLISCALIDQFNNNETNLNHAQLVFMTHDTNLLDRRRLRRDQIWFTEKDRSGATALYSLAEFKVRNDASYERDYIAGKYGAIPFLGGECRLNEETHAEESIEAQS